MNSRIPENWEQLSIFEQMGNIGSEVGRAIKAYKAQNERAFNGALSRAIDLFDATVLYWIKQEQTHRSKEILRAKYEFLGLFYDDKLYDAEAIERYFMQFATAARLRAQIRRCKTN